MVSEYITTIKLQVWAKKKPALPPKIGAGCKYPFRFTSDVNAYVQYTFTVWGHLKARKDNIFWEKICGEYPDQASPLVGRSIRRITFTGIGNTFYRSYRLWSISAEMRKPIATKRLLSEEKNCRWNVAPKRRIRGVVSLKLFLVRNNDSTK